MVIRKLSLPARIVALIVGTILAFLLTLGTSLGWMAQALDEESLLHERDQAANAASGLLDQMRVLMLGYAKWEAAAPLVQARDLGWIHDNIGAAAMSGVSFNLVVLWGGPFEADLGWRDDPAGAEARRGLVPPELLGQVEAHLRRIPLNLHRGTEFFAWIDGALHVVGAARIEPDAPHAVADLVSRDAATPRILLGRRLDGRIIAQIGESHLIHGLRILHGPPPEGAPGLALPGADGQPVAHLAWASDPAGTALLRRMAPPLVLVTALATALSGFGLVLVGRSASQLVAAELRASMAARTDPLTGLSNRAAFKDALALPARAGERAVLFLDVNDFKRINDSLGHAAGDEVVISIARRLAALAGPDAFLARIAGDEFVFVLRGPRADARAIRLARAVQEALLPPVSAQGHQLQVSTAMGYAVQDADDTRGADLVRQADFAMYEAKRLRGTGPVAFSAVIEAAAGDASRIERELRRALERTGELSVLYHPIVDIGGHMVRAEALARWTSPVLGHVPPDRFVAVAEQAGLIVELGRTLLRIIGDDLRDHPGLGVAVNVSPLQLMSPDFIPGITRDLRERGVDLSRVEVELTESVIVDDTRLAAERLAELHAAGFSSALDDFGTGYSSVGYLRKLGFRTLKIDRSIVSEMRSSPHGLAVVDGILTMGFGFGLNIVCEGVETPEDLRRLTDLGCALFQGYLFGPPLPIAELSRTWLAEPPGEAEAPRQAMAV